MKEIMAQLEKLYPHGNKVEDFIGFLIEHIDQEKPNAKSRMALHYRCARSKTEMCATKEWVDLSINLPTGNFSIPAEIEDRLKANYDDLCIGLAYCIEQISRNIKETELSLTKGKGK